MPEMTTWPVCSSVLTRKVGSSPISFDRPTPSFSWSLLVFGSIASEMTGSGKSIDSRTTGFFSSHSVSPVLDLLEADGRRDIAGVDLLDLLTLVGVHLQEAADALGALLGGVVDRRARRQHARVDADERELTDERVGHQLERQRRERRLVGCRTLDERLFLRVRIESLDRRARRAATADSPRPRRAAAARPCS